ncbi:hypothetical protein AK830_g11976 [Neonectria ditissima]|uniref:Uncharacterized protein n=1 Tax=Neonectria ditissima TaxID=78410 RepID=A0A0P7AKY2_9HYPO|nr:hypothetical protein AK830_g11976 [Neonectria ditissima]
MPDRGAPFRSVTESARERETYRYSTSLLSSAILNYHGSLLPAHKLTTAEDTALTAFAQLGTCQTGTTRSLISLFDETYQYIIAEATPTLPLIPNLRHEDRNEDLTHCGTAIPRSHGVCESALYEPRPSQDCVSKDSIELPVIIVRDLTADSKFAAKPYCQPGGSAHFYAAVPIRTSKGINIGVYCVLHSEPFDAWSDQHSQVLRNISRAIMRHLEGNRARAAHRRSERMNRGIGSFIENKATMSGWRLGSHAAAFETNDKLEGALNVKQQNRQDLQDLQDLQAERAARRESDTPQFKSSVSLDGQLHDQQSGTVKSEPTTPTPSHHSTDDYLTAAALSSPAHEPSRQNALDFIFSRAANLIRESIEVEGCLFLDAASGSFGGLGSPPTQDYKGPPTPQLSAYSSKSSSGSSSSSDETKGASSQREWPSCRVLGFSTSDKSSVDGEMNLALHTDVAEKFLSTLLRRYPRGKIFVFGANGELQSSDSSEEDRIGMVNGYTATPFGDTKDMPGHQQNAPRKKARHNPWARQKEGQVILKIFPGARSVAFVPVWDPKRNRWFAGGFVYSKTPTRVFLTETELSYLRAFGTLAMAESAKHELLLDDKAKSDVLSSLSHELRSPLHGIILGIELLSDTDLSVVQGDIAHTLETCGRTLSDTLDHLLDFSKINNFMATTKKKHQAAAGRGLRYGTAKTVEAGMMSLSSVVRLDRLAEEVVESVFAGFNFQQLSISQFASRKRDTHYDVTANQQQDKVQAEEVLGPAKLVSGELQMRFGDVSIFLLVDPACDWTFHTQPGAIRRIIMNLFGNALKYTQQGVIKVLLTQKQPKKRLRDNEKLVVITVTDTGSGISQDYLQNDLFKPFSQENHLSPGTGLGLSLVKKMTSQLRGHVSVQSRIGSGTTISVTLPLVQTVPLPTEVSARSDDELVQFVKELRGLRICLLGFDEHDANSDVPDLNDGVGDGNSFIQGICRDWLHLEVMSPSQTQTLTPDLVLLTESAISIRNQSEILTKPPCVVVCANALVAYQRSTTLNPIDLPGFVEYISQPIGPHKLGKILLLVFQRWTNSQTVSSPKEQTFKLSSDKMDLLPPQSAAETPRYFEQPALPLSTPEPMDIWQAKPLDHDESQSEPKKPRLTPPLSAAGEKTKYLLVDDNPINLKILSSYLKKLGQVYRTATNGQEAVDAYMVDPVGCRFIFLDVSMPVMDGFTASREIRAFERRHGLDSAFIVALTGLASEDAQREALGSGMDLFLTKPVQLRELNSILKAQGVVS